MPNPSELPGVPRLTDDEVMSITFLNVDQYSPEQREEAKRILDRIEAECKTLISEYTTVAQKIKASRRLALTLDDRKTMINSVQKSMFDRFEIEKTLNKIGFIRMVLM